MRLDTRGAGRGEMTSLGCTSSGRALVPSVSTSFRFLLVSDAVFRFLLDS